MMQYDFILRPMRRIDFIGHWHGNVRRDNGRPTFYDEDIVKECDVIIDIDQRRFEIVDTGEGDFMVDEIGYLGFDDHVDSPTLTMEFDTDEDALAFVDVLDDLRIDPWVVDFVYREDGKEVYAI